jgi:hypothetical protein
MVLADQNNSIFVPESKPLKNKKFSSTARRYQYENLEFHTKIRLRTFSPLIQRFVKISGDLNRPVARGPGPKPVAAKKQTSLGARACALVLRSRDFRDSYRLCF